MKGFTVMYGFLTSLLFLGALLVLLFLRHCVTMIRDYFFGAGDLLMPSAVCLAINILTIALWGIVLKGVTVKYFGSGVPLFEIILMLWHHTIPSYALEAYDLASHARAASSAGKPYFFAMWFIALIPSLMLRFRRG